MLAADSVVLFLHGPMLRTTRIFFSGLMAVAVRRGWSVQHATPPQGADAAYVRKLVSFWNPLGIVADYGHDKGMPLPPSELSTPFVCIDLDRSLLSRRKAPLPPRTGFVGCDSRAVAELAAKTMLKHDFAAYAFVSSYTRFYWSERRKRHFREALELNGRACRCFDGTGLATSGAAASGRLGQWLAALPKPCGLLAANDRTAALVLSVAAHEGIAVPDELSVLGIDDDEEVCESTNPPLSSIRCDFYGGGVQTGEMLGKLLARRQGRERASLYGTVRVTTRLSTRQILGQSPAIRLALETIRQRAADGISAADILPLIGGSRRSAERKFRMAVGHSVLDEILDVRFERVKELLATPTPLTDIANRTGFSSDNHLQRLFKSHFGMTLSAFRKGLPQVRDAIGGGLAAR